LPPPKLWVCHFGARLQNLFAHSNRKQILSRNVRVYLVADLFRQPAFWTAELLLPGWNFIASLQTMAANSALIDYLRRLTNDAISSVNIINLINYLKLYLQTVLFLLRVGNRRIF